MALPITPGKDDELLTKEADQPPGGSLSTAAVVTSGSPSAPSSPSSSSTTTTSTVTAAAVVPSAPTPSSPSSSAAFSGNSAASSLTATTDNAVTAVKLDNANTVFVGAATSTEITSNSGSENIVTLSTTAITTTSSDPALPEDINLIYFYVGNKSEIALVPTNSSSDDIKELFRSAAEAGPYDIVKLYTLEGRLINISPRIPPNTPANPYRLEVVAVHCNGILMEQVGIDLLSLEKRVSALEEILKNQGSPCDSIVELKEEVNQLRHKLENYEHLSWLGFYKALHPPPLPSPPKTPGVGYHKKSRDDKQAICDKFLKLCDVVLTKETCQLLREPTFDNWQWEDEEMLLLLQQMYLDLELPRKFDIEINILRNFLVNVYHHYNDVPFHNFRHCFCVTQMMFGMASYVNLCERVGDLEVLILLTSCICHDLDHPGYNNIYQINAQTELALRYNDISPLENHHCSIAFRILEDPECNIFRNLPTSTYRKIREGIIRCILATDMARHNEIVNQFREIIPYFDRNNKAHINLLSMVLIKVADISNEARPMDVAEPWLDCLLAEFFQQSDTEKLEGLPVTPFMDRDKITKPSSQCSFIGLVLLPLFEVLGQFFPELDPMIIAPVRYALDYYRRLNEAAQANKHRKSQDVGLNSSGLVHVVNNSSNNNSTTGGTNNEGNNAVQGPNNNNGSGTTTTTASTVGSTSSNSTVVAIRASSCSSAHETSMEGDANSASSNLCDNKIPSDPCNVNRVSRSNSVSMPNSTSAAMASSDARLMDPNNRNNNNAAAAVSMNPIAIAHRRASQLLVRGGSGSITSLRSAMTVRSGPGGHFTSFPSLESDSEREGGDSDDDEDDDNPITEVAVSERALKFKIATESSFDFSTSRKSSRENKSESSGQSGSLHSQIMSVRDEALTSKMVGENPQQPSFLSMREASLCSLAAATSAGVVTSPTSCCSSSENPAAAVATTPQSSLLAATGTIILPAGSSAKGKAKDSFFAKLRLFTERLSMGGDSGGSGGSTSGSPPPTTTTSGPSSHKSHTQGFNYFRRSGARKKQEGVLLDEKPATVSALMAARPFSMKQHRGSASDPEGREEFRRRHHTIHHTTTAGHFGSEGEQNNSELVSPECSPALSRSSAGGEQNSGADDEHRGSSSSSWKQCSGSLDSILSKDEANKKSPGKKLVLPRFSFHKRTQMGFMRRLSPNKGGSDSQQQQQQEPQPQS